MLTILGDALERIQSNLKPGKGGGGVGMSHSQIWIFDRAALCLKSQKKKSPSQRLQK